MSGDLISRSALIYAVDEIDWYSINEKSGKLIHGAESSVSALFKAGEIYEALASAPTVDAVEVVRCKDCKRCSTNTPDGLHWCDEHERGCLLDDDFCSYGERREDG